MSVQRVTEVKVPPQVLNIPAKESLQNETVVPMKPLAKPWKNPAQASHPSFNQEYPTEFRPSDVSGGGWWALVDIPKGTRMRRVTIEDKTLHGFASLQELDAAGWSLSEAVHYGIWHKSDPDRIFFLDPGTPCNHSDPTRTPSIYYNMEMPGVIELWTARDIKAGEEMFNDYSQDFGAVHWYDEECRKLGATPLGDIGEEINKLYQ
jgi:hypothetical protein